MSPMDPIPAQEAAVPRDSVAGRLLRAAVLAAGGVALGLLGNAVHPAGLPLSKPVLAQAELGQCAATDPKEHKALGMSAPEALTPVEALALRGQAGVVIGDLRPPALYARGHIAGAIHLPCAGSLGQAALDRLPSSAQLLLYDDDGRSAELQVAATTAALRGISRIYTLAGGFGAWTLSGLPSESGTCERCETR